MDEQTVIDVLTKRTYNQRREIAFAYERRAKKVSMYMMCFCINISLSIFCNNTPSSHFQDMISALKAALSGSLETVILGLMKSTAQYDASEIKASIKVNQIWKTFNWILIVSIKWEWHLDDLDT